MFLPNPNVGFSALPNCSTKRCTPLAPAKGAPAAIRIRARPTTDSASARRFTMISFCSAVGSSSMFGRGDGGATAQWPSPHVDPSKCRGGLFRRDRPSAECFGFVAVNVVGRDPEQGAGRGNGPRLSGGGVLPGDHVRGLAGRARREKIAAGVDA